MIIKETLNNKNKEKLLNNEEYLNNEGKIIYFAIDSDILYIINKFEILNSYKLKEQKWNLDKKDNVIGYNLNYIKEINDILKNVCENRKNK